MNETLRDYIVNKSWDELAALAWQQYLEQGRGVVVMFLDEPLASKKDGRPQAGYKLAYSVGESVAEMDLSAATMDIINTYKPEDEFMLAVIDEKSDGDVFQIGLMVKGRGLTPKQAFEQGRRPTKLTPEMLGMGRGH